MNPRGPGTAESRQAAAKPSVANQFDIASVLTQQQRVAQALTASGQKFLEGMQEIARRSALLQAALIQQALTGWASVTSAAGGARRGEDAVGQATAAAEATVASLRDVMEAACKCHTQAVATFRQRMAGAATGAECAAPPPSQT